ncbi:MAG TPA: 4-(cytidine 5'-diphospho)-2-C-methyl-D-erythritol kinase [Terracidiphilus sp.]|nr:4-(cytidine 5'-diphospho)-2-C-methyl-D-erythritol kinase [Terracidiphilus sp.]
MPTAVRSHAKINLGLHIGAPRSDGFHGLATVYQTLEIYDTVTVSARRTPATTIRLTTNDQRVPTDSRNTAWKMVELTLDRLGFAAEVDIHIEKRLPIQGGLGAGSANAVAALVGLETELGISPKPGAPSLAFETWEGSTRHTETPTEISGWSTHRLELAAQVGSDVPLFLFGGTVLGVDRGQKVSPLPDIPETWCVIAVPAVGISTPRAFSDWDALCAVEGLTLEASADKLNELSRAYAAAFSDSSGWAGWAGSSGVLSAGEDLAGPHESALVRTGIVSWIQNDFERVVFPQHPSLSAIKRLLAGEGTPEAAILASLSGSGSALFGLYNSLEKAEAAQARVKNEIENVEVRITRTLPRSRYWREMLLQDVR